MCPYVLLKIHSQTTKLKVKTSVTRNVSFYKNNQIKVKNNNKGKYSNMKKMKINKTKKQQQQNKLNEKK